MSIEKASPSDLYHKLKLWYLINIWGPYFDIKDGIAYSLKTSATDHEKTKELSGLFAQEFYDYIKSDFERLNTLNFSSNERLAINLSLFTPANDLNIHTSFRKLLWRNEPLLERGESMGYFRGIRGSKIIGWSFGLSVREQYPSYIRFFTASHQGYMQGRIIILPNRADMEPDIKRRFNSFRSVNNIKISTQ